MIRLHGGPAAAPRVGRRWLCLLLALATLGGCAVAAPIDRDREREWHSLLRGHAATLFVQAFQDGLGSFALAGFDTLRAVYQPVPDGMPLELARFANPHSAENPNGDLRANRQLVDIVDRLPALTRRYAPTQQSVEENYGLIIGQAGAVTARPGSRNRPPEPTPAAKIISDARQLFSRTALLPLSPWDGGTWHTALARPANWAERDAPFTRFELTAGLALAAPFPSPWAAPLRRLDTAIEQLLDQGVPFRELTVRFDALVVRVERPWLRPVLFTRDDWTLGAGESPGTVSSGLCLQDRPDALLPLIPTAFVVIKNLEARGNVPPTKHHHGQSLGVLVPGAFIAGFVDECVPFAPRR